MISQDDKDALKIEARVLGDDARWLAKQLGLVLHPTDPRLKVMQGWSYALDYIIATIIKDLEQ